MGMRSFKECFSELCEQENSSEMIALDDGNRIVRCTYSEVFHMCLRAGSLFEASGLKPGDSIVAILPNSIEAAVLFFSSMLFGINYAPLPCAVSNREFDNWLEIVKPKLIVRKYGIAEYTSDRIPQITSDAAGDVDFLSGRQESQLPAGRGSPSCIYLMTSGTTGIPKALSIDSDKLWNSGYAFASYHGLVGKRCRFWNYLPMSYLGGLFNLALIPLCTRGSFIISEPFSGKTILNFWNFVDKHRIDSLWFVPSIVSGLLKLSKLIGDKGIADTHNIETAFLGTAPISLDNKQEFERRFGIQLLENFALSETTFITSEIPENIRFREDSSVGSILPYVNIKLLPVKEVKNTYEIWVYTPYLFNGYLSSNGELILEKDEDGYFNTRDLGYLNDDNCLVLCGRDRDIIKKGGLFVSLVEIEHTVRNVKFVEDVAAVPIKHDFYGESYILFVIFKPQNNQKPPVEQLRLWMLENFVNYKNPDKIVSVSEFPRTASGKIQKMRLLSLSKES